MTRRDAVQRIATLAAIPLVAGCGVDRLLSPALSFSNLSMRPVTLIGGGDPHALSASYAHTTGKVIASMLAADSSAWAFCNGDLVDNGTAQEYRDYYHKAWGAFRERTLFTMGNHDHKADPTGTAYYNYVGAFGGPRGKGYYAKTFGAWRCYFLNSEIRREEQAAWLKADLPSWTRYHIMAMFHQPHTVSPCGAHTGGKPMSWPGFSGTGQFWEPLQAHGAEFVISGHVHRWERFPRMLRNPSDLFTGTLSDKGIRQFVVGTGGTPTMAPSVAHRYVQKIVVTRGVAQFTLYSDRYQWKLTDNGVVLDSGTQACRKPPVA